MKNLSDSRGKKLLKICICLFMAAVLLASSFFQKRRAKEEIAESREDTAASSGTEVEPELYGEGRPITIYFTNTAQIDERGALPYKESEFLVERTQEYLDGQGIKAEELRVITGSLKRDGEKTSFSCEIQNLDLVLEIGFYGENGPYNFALKNGGLVQ